ncbi:hypothetical protein PMAYCL1PPCAC_27950, partial [Pristionchus mayeri]
QSSNSSEFLQQPEQQRQQPENPTDQSSPSQSPVAKKRKLLNPSVDDPDWETFPWKKWPVFDGFLLPHLFTNKDCSDLLNLSKVSKLFYFGVSEFMARKKNRPGFDTLRLRRAGGGLVVEIRLFPSALSYYNLTSMDNTRFQRLRINGGPALRVVLTGPEDPIVDQLAGFLSSSIKKVTIGGYASESTPDFALLSLCAKILSASTIDNLKILLLILDGFSDPFIISIIARVRNHLEILFYGQPSSVHSAAFITTLFSLSIRHVFLNNPNSMMHPDSFIGLPRSFWEQNILQQLSNGSIEWLETGTR